MVKQQGGIQAANCVAWEFLSGAWVWASHFHSHFRIKKQTQIINCATKGWLAEVELLFCKE